MDTIGSTTVIGAGATVLLAVAGCLITRRSNRTTRSQQNSYFSVKSRSDSEYFEYNGSPSLMSNHQNSAAGHRTLRAANTKRKRPRDFKNIISKGYEFIDRSSFIKDVIEFNGRVALILRPQGFGKTTNLSMLYYFFNPEREGKETREKMFCDLEIWKNQPLIQKHFMKSPVIYFHMTNIKGTTWEEMFTDIKRMISWIYNDHGYLQNRISLKHREIFVRILNCSPTLSVQTWERALKDLSVHLYQCHNQHSIVLVDDFDHAVLLADQHGFHDKALPFFKNMFHELLKDNPYLYKAIIMGTETNRRSNFLPQHTWEYSFASAEKIFIDKFGFFESDVRKSAQKYHFDIEVEDAIIKKSQSSKIGKGKGKRYLYNPEKVWREIIDELGETNEAIW